MPNLLIGFIGQGFIGKSYADDFVNRGYEVVRYSLEPEYINNQARIADCDIVFIAVPTPTTPAGFNYDILKDVLALAGPKKSVVIKSTILPGTCAQLQELYPNLYIFHSPEFLTEKNAAFDAAHPTRNIIGCPVSNEEYQRRAQEILDILAPAALSFICSAKEAEIIKYAANSFLFMKVIYANIFYDLAAKEGSDWEKIVAGLSADPRIGTSHLNPVHSSGINKKIGRGAGGNCFVKDFAALREYAEKAGLDELSLDFLRSAEKKNISLLKNSGKDIELLESVYGV